MTDDDSPEAAKPEHELIVQPVPAISAGRGYSTPQREELLISCVCGWRSVHGKNARDARRNFERHLRKVATGKPDPGSMPVGRDEPREVLYQHRQEP